jgi:cardiolipin synthase A/B
MRLLVDSQEFWRSLAEDIRAARDYLFVQTLSLEGDSVGAMLSHALRASRCSDRRVLVDAFSKYVLSDRFVYSPRSLFDGAVRTEVRETSQLVVELRSAGVRVEFTNPVGPLFLRLPARNHKKLVVIDDAVTYIGGINFSEHNFAWHDLMLRVEEPDVAAFLRDDFLSTWRGEDLRRSKSFDGIELHTLDGRTNADAFEPVVGLLERAREQIFVESAYLSFPFCQWLRDARRRGVRVIVVSPDANNSALYKRNVMWEAARSGFELQFFQGRMSHLKAMLIDDEWLVLGSSNFNWLSYHLQQDIVAVVTDRALIADFRARIVEPDLQLSAPSGDRASSLRGRLSDLGLRWSAGLSILACR